MCFFLSTSSSKAGTSRDDLFVFFLAPVLHELKCNMMSNNLITEVKQQLVMLVLEWVTA